MNCDEQTKTTIPPLFTGSRVNANLYNGSLAHVVLHRRK